MPILRFLSLLFAGAFSLLANENPFRFRNPPRHPPRNHRPRPKRLRRVGHITSLAANNNAIRLRTTHDHWRGYHLEFTRLQNTWRLTSISEWTD